MNIKKLCEGGIYPVELQNEATDKFTEAVNNILGGNNEVTSLELIPSLGFGGSGRYWYKATIVIDVETIEKYISEENTPEAFRLKNNNMLHINPYSDIDVTCSADSKSYNDGITLDADSKSDADMDKLLKDSNFIGSKLVELLYNKESELVDLLKEYEEIDNEELDEGLIPIEESSDAKQEFEDILKPFEATEIKSIDEFTDEDGTYYSANIIMSDDATSKIDKLIKDNGAQFIDNGEYTFNTKYGYCDISDDGDQFTIECFVPIECCEQIDESMIPIEESSDPKLGKKIKQLKGWKIYQGTDSYGYETFRCFTPDEDRPAVGYEDWECETLDQAISWIENYDLEESAKVTNKSNLDNLSNVSEGDSSDSKTIEIITEKDTFGDYEENVFTALDNIDTLISSYQEVNKDSLKELITGLEEELDTIQKVYMKLATGIEQEIL